MEMTTHFFCCGVAGSGSSAGGGGGGGSGRSSARSRESNTSDACRCGGGGGSTSILGGGGGAATAAGSKGAICIVCRIGFAGIGGGFFASLMSAAAMRAQTREARRRGPRRAAKAQRSAGTAHWSRGRGSARVGGGVARLTINQSTVISVRAGRRAGGCNEGGVQWHGACASGRRCGAARGKRGTALFGSANDV